MSKKTIRLITRFTTDYQLLNFSGSPRIQDEYQSGQTFFDVNGNIVKEVRLSRSGAPEEEILYTYNDSGKLIEEQINYIPEGTFEKRVILRNDKGEIVEEQKHFGDNSIELTRYAYDDKGNICEVLKFTEDDVLEGKVVIKYNEDNKPIEELKYDEDGHTIEHHVQKYDSSGHLIEQIEYSPGNEIAFRTVYEVNEKGQVITAEVFNSKGGVISRNKAVYDDKGNVVEKEIEDYTAQIVKKNLKYTYDNNNNCTLEEMYASNGTLLRKITTTFDEGGNPLEEINFESDTSYGGRDECFGSKYVYEFYEE